MATRDERTMERELKEIEKINVWLDKNKLQLEKWVAMINKAGYLNKFNELHTAWSNSRDGYTWKIRSTDAETEALIDYVKDEMNKVETDCKENKKLVKIHERLYSIWSKVDDFNQKYSSLTLAKRRYAEVEERVRNADSAKTPEQREEDKRRESAKELRKYLKEELKNIEVPSLDKWLKRYKEMYLESVDYLLEKGEITNYRAGSLRRNVDSAVEEQKMNIIVRSWEKVGRITELKIAHVGDDGGFNGIVVGEKGTVKITTIIAGGYNIQVLHFRVLVHEID